jgi:hypothetical protein
MLGTLLLVFVLVGLSWVMLYRVTTGISSCCVRHWFVVSANRRVLAQCLVCKELSIKEICSNLSTRLLTESDLME